MKLFLLKIKWLLSFILILCLSNLYSQTFTDLNGEIDLMDLQDGCVSWGDYDVDGDLDIVLIGKNSSNTLYSIIYRNDGDYVFTNIEAGITDIYNGSATWSDIDGDRDLDLLLSGENSSFNPVTQLYINEGSDTFTPRASNIIDIFSTLVDWGDYDKDSYLDILINGDLGAFSQSKIYKNNNGTFIDIAIDVPDMIWGDVNWVDYDNDSDLDVFITGYNFEIPVAKLFNNNSGVFTETDIEIMGIMHGSSSWGDFDNDGDQDLLISGESPEGDTTIIYRNDNEGKFVEITTNLPPCGKCFAEWADFNHDNFLDIIIFSSTISTIFRNDGNGDGLFSDLKLDLVNLYNPSCSIGDFDMDNDLDILVSGEKSEGQITIVYRNDLKGPVADFTADTTSGIDSLNVQFTDLSIHEDSLKNIIKWEWDFDNDGIFDSQAQNPEYIFTNPGNYSVKLKVSDSTFYRSTVKESFIRIASSKPIIFSVSDISNDQGGWVEVNFARSFYDDDTLESTEIYNIEIDDGSGWTSATSINAVGRSVYSINVPTTKDSTAETDGLINFRVIAVMNEGNFESVTLQGYSVDNLAPAIPENIVASLTSEQYIQLTWSSQTDQDFDHFQIYRSTDGTMFEIYNVVIDTFFNDENVTQGNTYYYSISAIDLHGNESLKSDIVHIMMTNMENLYDIPDCYFLSQNYPNPFNPNTTIKYGLKDPSDVNIIIYDNLGRKVIELKNCKQNAGYHQITWNGKNYLNQQISSGIYFYKLETKMYTSIKKMIFIK